MVVNRDVKWGFRLCYQARLCRYRAEDRLMSNLRLKQSRPCRRQPFHFDEYDPAFLPTLLMNPSAFQVDRV